MPSYDDIGRNYAEYRQEDPSILDAILSATEGRRSNPVGRITGTMSRGTTIRSRFMDGTGGPDASSPTST